MVIIAWCGRHARRRQYHDPLFCVRFNQKEQRNDKHNVRRNSRLVAWRVKHTTVTWGTESSFVWCQYMSFPPVLCVPKTSLHDNYLRFSNARKGFCLSFVFCFLKFCFLFGGNCSATPTIKTYSFQERKFLFTHIEVWCWLLFFLMYPTLFVWFICFWEVWANTPDPRRFCPFKVARACEALLRQCNGLVWRSWDGLSPGPFWGVADADFVHDQLRSPVALLSVFVCWKVKRGVLWQCLTYFVSGVAKRGKKQNPSMTVTWGTESSFVWCQQYIVSPGFVRPKNIVTRQLLAI